MSSPQIDTNQPRNIYLVIQILILALFYILYSFLKVDNPLIFVAVSYLVIVISLQLILTFHYKKGFSYYKREDYNQAIPHFKKSSDFFLKHRWIDNYRNIILTSASPSSYLELSLINLADCYEHLEDNENAKKLYLQALSLFPGSEQAKAALNIMNVMKK